MEHLSKTKPHLYHPEMFPQVGHRNILDKCAAPITARTFVGTTSQLHMKVLGNVPQHPPVDISFTQQP